MMKIRKHLHKFYGVARNRIVPQLVYSQDIYQQLLESTVTNESVWLDVGCGHQLLPSWKQQDERCLVSKSARVVGIDYDYPSLVKHGTIAARVCGVADSLPFPDESFNVVTANMVVEHLDNPLVQFAEISRVLRRDGIFVFHTVNKWGYFALMRRMVPWFLVKPAARLLDGRDSTDVFEVQYKANTEKEIAKLASVASFDVEAIRIISSDAVFALVPPIAVMELIGIRLLMSSRLRKFRSNLIVVLRKL
jgi:ubiquinone/menaquinone biosynthesis C-methylase UbiE